MVPCQISAISTVDIQNQAGQVPATVTVLPLFHLFPTPSSPPPCPKLQKHQQIIKTHIQDIPLSPYVFYSMLILSITHDVIKRKTMRRLYLDSLIRKKYKRTI